MTGQVFIEEHEATGLGLPTGRVHLYLVYRENGTGAEYVLRAGPRDLQFFNAPFVIETNVPMARSEDDRDGDSPADRSSTALDFGALSDDQAWAMMVKYARAIDAADARYSVFDQNSNAFVGALLHAAGGDPVAMLPRGVSSSEALGITSWPGLVEEVTPPADWVFRGTAGDDLRVGLQIDEVFLLGAGDDRLSAGRGNDLARGGAGRDEMDGEAGHDRLFGQSGADLLRGGAGNDRLDGGIGADLLSGGPGADTLVGGAGADRLAGGSGADVFVFAAGGGSDRIADFQDGADRLQIAAPGVDGFDDLTVTQAGADLRVSFAGTAVTLAGVAAADFDAADVIFLPPADDLVA